MPVPSAARARRGTAPESAAAPVTFRKSRRRIVIGCLRAARNDQRISSAFQACFSLVAWKIDALARASASLDDATAWSKSPASAAFFAAARVPAVVGHLLRNAAASFLAA